MDGPLQCALYLVILTFGRLLVKSTKQHPQYHQALISCFPFCYLKLLFSIIVQRGTGKLRFIG